MDTVAAKHAPAEMQKPTTYTIGHFLVGTNPRYPTKYDRTFYYLMREKVGEDFDRAHHHIGMFAPILSNASSVSNVLALTAALLGCADGYNGKPPRPFAEVEKDLRTLANYRKRSQGTIEPNEEEATALVSLFLPLVPDMDRTGRPRPGSMFIDTNYTGGWQYPRSWGNLDDFLVPNTCYAPEAIARMCKKDGTLDYKDASDRKLLSHVEACMAVIGNAHIMRDAGLLRKGLGIFTNRWETPNDLAKVMASDGGEVGIHYDRFTVLANAFGQMAINLGVDRKGFSLDKVCVMLMFKQALLYYVKGVASVYGKLAGLSRFNDFKLSREDYEFLGEAEETIQKPRQNGQIDSDLFGPNTDKILAFMRDPDINKMLEAYKKRFGLAENSHCSIYNTNPDIDHLLMQIPGEEKPLEFIEKKIIGR